VAQLNPLLKGAGLLLTARSCADVRSRNAVRGRCVLSEPAALRCHGAAFLVVCCSSKGACLAFRGLRCRSVRRHRFAVSACCVRRPLHTQAAHARSSWRCTDDRRLVAGCGKGTARHVTLVCIGGVPGVFLVVYAGSVGNPTRARGRPADRDRRRKLGDLHVRGEPFSGGRRAYTALTCLPRSGDHLVTRR